jgi:acyl-CoA hydrolase
VANAWGDAWGASGQAWVDAWNQGTAARIIAQGAIGACAVLNTTLHRSVCMGHVIESDVRLGEVGCTSVTMGNELHRCAATGKTIERSTCFDAVNEAEAIIVGPVYNWVDMDD